MCPWKPLNLAPRALVLVTILPETCFVWVVALTNGALVPLCMWWSLEPAAGLALEQGQRPFLVMKWLPQLCASHLQPSRAGPAASASFIRNADFPEIPSPVSVYIRGCLVGQHDVTGPLWLQRSLGKGGITAPVWQEQLQASVNEETWGWTVLG